MTTCIHCVCQGNGDYCYNCGQSYAVKRITMSGLFHEVAHAFTHIEKGFLYTLKELAIHPGNMQRKYLAGDRVKHQKPFSMFFICATITGLAFYWIVYSSVLTNVDEAQNYFYKNYFVFLQVFLLPFYSFIVWLLFWNKKFYYSEILTMQLYTTSFLLPLLVPINLINSIFSHRLPVSYIELTVLTAYCIWTNLVFFDKQPAWQVVLKSAIALVINWFASTTIMGWIVHRMI